MDPKSYGESPDQGGMEDVGDVPHLKIPAPDGNGNPAT